jgi:predicted N-acetyltransferase YhbS
MMLTDVTVRPATASDDHAVGELLVESFVSSYSKKLPEVVVSENRKSTLRAVAEKRAVASVWVAEWNARVVGTVALWPQGAAGSEVFLPNATDLRHLAVHDSVKGRGVSTQLLDAAESHARHLKAAVVCVHTRRGAVGVRRIYESRGYVRHPDGDLDFLPELYLEGLFLKL